MQFQVLAMIQPPKQKLYPSGQLPNSKAAPIPQTLSHHSRCLGAEVVELISSVLSQNAHFLLKQQTYQPCASSQNPTITSFQVT